MHQHFTNDQRTVVSVLHITACIHAETNLNVDVKLVRFSTKSNPFV